MDVDTGILKTDVDDFVNLIRKSGKITIADAAKQMGVAENIVEAWTDFLVEEKVVGVEYKFTTAYIFLDAISVNQSDQLLALQTKEEFFEKAARRQIPDYETVKLWIKYLSLNEDKIRSSFLKRARARGISLEKIDQLWRKYYDSMRVGK
jgi:hypothetical protein